MRRQSAAQCWEGCVCVGSKQRVVVTTNCCMLVTVETYICQSHYLLLLPLLNASKGWDVNIILYYCFYFHCGTDHRIRFDSGSRWQGSFHGLHSVDFQFHKGDEMKCEIQWSVKYNEVWGKKQEIEWNNLQTIINYKQHKQKFSWQWDRRLCWTIPALSFSQQGRGQ